MEKIVYKQLSKVDDTLFAELKKESTDLAKSLNWNNGKNQIILQTYKEAFTDYLDGIGKLSEHTRTNQYDYKHTQQELIGTKIDEFLKKYKVYRSRLMLVPPRTCYSIHKDASPRLHLVLNTDPQCMFVFPEQQQVFNLPEDKFIYYVNTMLPHTFMNCSLNHRIHLVMCV